MNSNNNLSALVGQYINRYYHTDVQPIGRIIGIKGKNTLLVQRVVATEQMTEMEFIPGGFAAHCSNNRAQRWAFEDKEEVIELRYSKKLLKSCQIHDQPVKFYDFNF